MLRLFCTFSYWPNSFGQIFLDFPPPAACSWFFWSLSPDPCLELPSQTLEPKALYIHDERLHKSWWWWSKASLSHLCAGHNERVHKRTKLAVGLIVPPGKSPYEGSYPPPSLPEKAKSTHIKSVFSKCCVWINLIVYVEFRALNSF